MISKNIRDALVLAVVAAGCGWGIGALLARDVGQRTDGLVGQDDFAALHAEVGMLRRDIRALQVDAVEWRTLLRAEREKEAHTSPTVAELEADADATATVPSDCPEGKLPPELDPYQNGASLKRDYVPREEGP